MRFAALTLVALVTAPALADVRIDDQGRVVRSWPGGVWPGDQKYYEPGSFEFYVPGEKVVAASATSAASTNGSDDALDEVNAYRARRGLPPFARDPGLTMAAAACAKFRAAHLIAGHTSNDFGFVPAGASARAAGCAAWHPSMGWGSCCADDHYAYAGAAWAMGSDGRRYMHLFVR